MNAGHYSVFNPAGKKVADCGHLKDAILLIAMKGEGYYYQFRPEMGPIVDVENQKQLSTTDIVINMDGGVGGSWSEVPNQLVLDQGDGEIFLS